MWFVELVRTLAWPVTTGLIVFWLRPSLAECLRSLATRKVAITAPGVSATLEAAQQKGAGTSPAVDDLIGENVKGGTAALSLTIKQNVKFPPTPNLNAAAAELEIKLAEQIADAAPEVREAVLLRHLANTRLQGGHEYVYNRIFGSQISGLKRLNELGKVTIHDASIFAEPSIKKNPEVYKDYGFGGWLGFLVLNGLVTEKDGFLYITKIGRDFLQYLTTSRLTELKSF